MPLELVPKKRHSVPVIIAAHPHSNNNHTTVRSDQITPRPLSSAISTNLASPPLLYSALSPCNLRPYQAPQLRRNRSPYLTLTTHLQSPPFAMAAALDTLRSIDSTPLVRELSLSFNRAKRAAKPYVPFITRTFLVIAFIEDAFRTLIEYKSQLLFFKRELYIPPFIAFLLIGLSTSATFIGSVLVFFKKFEKRGAQTLLAAVAYQQLIYGRHSPITSGNFGFLIRNMCLAGTLMLMMTNQRIKDGLPALPGIPDSANKDNQRDNIALVTRFLLGLLCLEMFDVIGWAWALVVVPVAFFVLIGYKTDFMGLLLMVFYTIATLTSKQFWFIDSSKHVYAAFERDVMRYEFLQTISIMSGLVMLIMSGPGALSLDEKLKRGKAW